MDRLFKPREVAELLGISIKTLDSHVAAGDLAYIVVGKGKLRTCRRFSVEDVERFKQRQRRTEAAPAGRVGRSRFTRPEPISLNQVIGFSHRLAARAASPSGDVELAARDVALDL